MLSLGRSGSTLLMRLINTLDSVYLFGEHGGIFRHFRSLYDSLHENAEHQRVNAEHILRKDGYDGLFTSWATPFDRGELIGELRGVLSNLYTRRIPEKKLNAWGFKEIRYGADDVDFLRVIWPTARFIFLTRDIVPLFRSHFIAFKFKRRIERSEMIAFISTYQDFVMKAKQECDERADLSLHVRYEDMISHPAETMEPIINLVELDPLAADWGRIFRILDERLDYIGEDAKTGSEIDDQMEEFMSLIETSEHNTG